MPARFPYLALGTGATSGAAEGVLDLRNAVVLCVGEEVLAHGLGGHAVENDLVVFEGDLRPAIAVGSEGEALILGVAAGRNLVAANEVRQGALLHCTEGVHGGLGRLEEHGRVAIAVELLNLCLGLGHDVAVGKVHVRDGHDSGGPLLLRGLDLAHRDRHHLMRLWR
eukprot:scaffold25100_cov68-Phaeocystis_antarctica.AAC.3